VLKHGEVVGGGLGSGSHLVVVERDIHSPVEAVFDRPVGAHGVGDSPSVRRQAADIETPLVGGFLPEVPCDSITANERKPFHWLGLSRQSSWPKT
jgi:hypothetical protein